MTSPFRELGADGLPLTEMNGRVRCTLIKELRTEDIDVITQTPSTSRRYLIELQEQLKTYQDENKQKDELIQKLASMEITLPPNRTIDATVGAGIATQSARGEVAALQVKVESLHNSLRERQTDLDTKEDTIIVLRKENEALKEDNARLTTVAENLTNQMEEYDGAQNAFETLKSRNQLAVQTLQIQYREAQDRIAELESRLRTHLDERERAEQSTVTIESKHLAFIEEVTHLVGADSQDLLLVKLGDIIQDNAAMKVKIVTLNETLAATELEQKASRETIMRLVSEVSREQQDQGEYSRTREEMRQDMERMALERKDLQNQILSFEERLDASQRALRACRDELQDREALLARLECERRETNYSAHSTEKQLVAFLESASALLGTAYAHCPATEEAVKERIRTMARDVQEKNSTIDTLEQRLRTVTRQFEGQLDSVKQVDRHSRHGEAEYLNYRERIRVLEQELASSDVVKDGLRADKEKFFRYMQKLAEVMKMDRINADIGFDMVGEGLVARGEQLARLEADALADRSTTIYSLKRRLRQMKEQMESKDLHLDLLRKKVATLEERLHGQSEVSKEKDEESQRVRRVCKQLESTQRQVEELRTENVNLKAQLLETSNLKITAIEQDKEMKNLERTLEKLERVRQKQAKKISELKTAVNSQEREVGDTRAVSENAVQALSSELRTTKQGLEEARRKERQLLDFRAVIGRMLGLDIDALAIPDYEIINRLERLVQAHQSNVYTAYSTDKTLHDVDEGFRSGYRDAQRLLGRRKISPRRIHGQDRPRSVSPVHRDERRY